MMSQYISEQKIEELEMKANEARELLIEMLVEAGSGHTAGPLGMADIFTAMYFHVLKHNPAKPDWEERDRLILSNGHITPIRYVLMAMAGYFPHDCPNPEPSGPDVVSTPGNLSRSGWPCKRVPSLRNVFNSSTGKYPAMAMETYLIGQIWPLDKNSQSLSSQ